jgi:L-ribulose-5-phosphate 4-epimerase
MLEELRREVCLANKELPRQGLVTMTSGNVSGRDPQTGLVAIKPSGVSFEALTPEDIVLVDPEGKVVEGRLKPSVDTVTHLVIFRGLAEMNAVIHTHSNYATAFAACGQPIPVYLTAMADELGGPIPCGAFARIGGEEIGRVVVETIGLCRACLLQNHGVFAVGPTVAAALKTAVMVEDLAKTTWLALQLGTPIPIPGAEVRQLYERYHAKYGQG